MHAGFAETDITPPLGTAKIGWLKLLVPDRVLDPLFARALCVSSADTTLCVVQLDTLSVRWTTAEAIRRGVEGRTGVPPGNVMVCATHNHGGPAVAGLGDVPRDDAYHDHLVNVCVDLVAAAHAARAPARIGTGRTAVFNVTHNRRVLHRDGLVRTHGTFDHPDALCLEGPIDPELAVLAFRSTDDRPLGLLVNFACHPAHHGAGKAFTAGWPGQLALRLKEAGWPCPMFVNGAAGNLGTSDPRRNGADPGMEAVGRRMARAVERALGQAAWTGDAPLRAARTTVELPYRSATEEEVRGTVPGAQRFVDPAVYDRGMPALCRRIRERGSQPAEVQALHVGNTALLSLPCEPFCELGLQIKERADPVRALVAGYSNGMVGYVPTRQAFARGGYETTFAGSSRQSPAAGERLTDAAVRLARARA